ncbi:MAG TPA: hypothetical protein DCQ43_04895, partial [Treponema sp.]|nr:hypothetical protein [Treponema sp.]
MKQPTKQFFYAVCLLCFCFFVFSCNNYLQTPQAEEPDRIYTITGSLTSQLEGAVPSEIVEEISQERTAMPVMSLSSSLYYSVSATKGSNTIDGTVDATTLKYSIGLGVGTWTVRVIAYKNAAKTQAVLKGSTTLTVSSSGSSGTTAIALNGITDDTSATGAFILSVSFATTVKKISIALHKSDGTHTTNNYDVTSTSSN